MQQAAQGTSGKHAVLQFQRQSAGARHGNPCAHRIRAGDDRFQLGCLITQDEGLTIANKDTVLTTVLHHHLGANQFTQVAHQLIALVKQVVWHLAVGGIADQNNLFVQVGDLLRVDVDQINAAYNLIVGIDVQPRQILACCPELVGHSLRRTDQLLPCGGVGRRVRHCLNPSEQCLHQRRQTAGLIGQQVVDLVDLPILG